MVILVPPAAGVVSVTTGRGGIFVRIQTPGGMNWEFASPERDQIDDPGG